MKPVLKAIGQFLNSFFLEGENNKSVLKIILSGVLMVWLGLIFIYIYSWQSTNTSSVFGVGCLVAFAALGSGGILGFIFGIPRVLVNSEIEKINDDTKRNSLYQPNTNLFLILRVYLVLLVGKNWFAFQVFQRLYFY